MNDDDRRRLFDGVRAIYADLERELSAMGGRCERSGRCCRFREFGHRLYLTTPELIYMLDGLDPAALEVPEDRCPFLSADPDGKAVCGRRDNRAIGCRIFFCNVLDQAPFNEVYERHHARMTALCERFGLPYEYRELLSALRDLGGANGPSGSRVSP
jgi:Fe-S-cluster containining protein